MPTENAADTRKTDVETELIALQADLRGLVDSVQRLVADSPSLARESLEARIRREPMKAAAIAAAIGFVCSRILLR
jgi:ElaB/YqjD/DUF883 family membrane-anchored ribosome-binding protein